MTFLIAFLLSFIGCWVLVPMAFALARLLGVYVIVPERQCVVYVLFGKVLATIDEPGIHFLLPRLGLSAFIVNWLGTRHVIDMRLDQQYQRSQPVNSEEGAPMGIGIWFEMFISDPVAYLFKNADPRGSLGANVSNSTVRCLSNLPLNAMLINRHSMSSTVRDEVSPKSHEWGYRLGSVYIRKVHFRDVAMIRQIESKVVNRLRQVTSAIKQDGANQVSIITSTAERRAAIEFAKASAIRPQLVGAALNEVSRDPEVASALFSILETQKALAGNGRITLIPPGHPLLEQSLAAEVDGVPAAGGVALAEATSAVPSVSPLGAWPFKPPTTPGGPRGNV
jgi:regulator of protease activity HflC (stomatin/prohibitin superfamily)